MVQADLFPRRPSALGCAITWIPARPSSPLEHAVYDFESRMLHDFLHGLAAHLTPDGEGLDDPVRPGRHLGLRSGTPCSPPSTGRLKVIDRIDVRPHHPRAADASDPLTTRPRGGSDLLWRLGKKKLEPRSTTEHTE